MPDPFRTYKPGDKAPHDAATFSAFANAARFARDNERGISAQSLSQFRNAAIVRVKNQTGGPLSRASVIALDSPLFIPSVDENAFLNEVIFRGVTPDIDAHVGRFAILLEGAPDDRIVRAYVAGVCPVRVDIVDDDHRFAEITDAVTSKLTSVEYGSAEILWREGDAGYGYVDGYATGEQWALVRLGNKPPQDYLATVGASPILAVSAGVQSSGTVTIIKCVGGTESSSGRDVTVYNPATSAIPAGSKIIIGWMDGAWRIKEKLDC